MVRYLVSSFVVVSALVSCQGSSKSEIKAAVEGSQGLKHSYLCNGKWENSTVEVTFKNRTYSNGKTDQELNYTYDKGHGGDSIGLDMNDENARKTTTIVENELGIYLNLGTSSIMIAPAPLTIDERMSGLKRAAANEFSALMLDYTQGGKRIVELHCKIQ